MDADTDWKTILGMGKEIRKLRRQVRALRKAVKPFAMDIRDALDLEDAVGYIGMSDIQRAKRIYELTGEKNG